MSAMRSARDRARAEVQTEILTVARRHLAEQGPAGLSLRAVARDLEIVPSAVYRYFENRDVLLTALIVQAYDSLGDAADAAFEKASRRRPLQRWMAVAKQVREWALTNPHEYALLYGSPVPGYKAPDDTIVPGTRVTLTLLRIVREANEDGLLRPEPANMSKATRNDLDSLLQIAAPDVPLHAMLWMVAAWTQMFGLVSFELFGQTKGLFTRGDAAFTDTVSLLAQRIGLLEP